MKFVNQVTSLIGNAIDKNEEDRKAGELTLIMRLPSHTDAIVKLQG